MGTEYLLEMKDICKSFPGVKALDHVHLNVRPGQVHALMGENGAGKSTLMKCLFGIYHKDAGEITLNGKEINFKSPHDALNHGVSMIHQELEQVQMRNVADNIWLGRYPTRLGQIDDGRMLRDTEALMKEFGIDIDPRTKISDLSVSMRQMVEIVKAASWNAKVIVMDEPTSSLTEKETEKLFEIIACGVIDCPPGLPVFVTAGISYGWQGAVVQLVILAVTFLIWTPFVLISNKQPQAEE